MRTATSPSYKKNEITSIIDTMTKEEMAWTIKLLTDRILVFSNNAVPEQTVRPTWWNRPLSEATKRLMPKKRADLGDDYKEQLADILEEKYL